MNKKRILTALRLLSHWSLGATIGSIITTNNFNDWAITFFIMYLAVQLTGTISSKG